MRLWTGDVLDRETLEFIGGKPGIRTGNHCDNFIKDNQTDLKEKRKNETEVFVS